MGWARSDGRVEPGNECLSRSGWDGRDLHLHLLAREGIRAGQPECLNSSRHTNNPALSRHVHVLLVDSRTCLLLGRLSSARGHVVRAGRQACPKVRPTGRPVPSRSAVRTSGSTSTIPRHVEHCAHVFHSAAPGRGAAAPLLSFAESRVAD